MPGHNTTPGQRTGGHAPRSAGPSDEGPTQTSRVVGSPIRSPNRVQQVVGKELQTFVEFPPMQRGASFNLDAVKAELEKRIAQAETAAKGPGH